MPISTRRALMGGSYADKVLGTGPIAYWPLWEAAGATAQCLVNTAQNGTAVGVTWASDLTGPFGTPAPFFDGANDYVNILTAPLIAALNGAEGSCAIWTKVANAGVWTDGTQRMAFYTVDTTDWNELFYLAKSSVNDAWRFQRTGNGVNSVVAPGSGSSVVWKYWTITWSESADQFKAFVDGAQVGATQVGLGAWAGTVERAFVGASTNVPGNPWHGWLGHTAVWDRPLGAGEITALANP